MLLKFSGSLPVAFTKKLHKNSAMNALYATQALEIYDVTEIHIQVTFKK